MFQFTRLEWVPQDQSSFVNSPGLIADFHALSSNAKTSPVSPYQLDQMYSRLETTPPTKHGKPRFADNKCFTDLLHLGLLAQRFLSTIKLGRSLSFVSKVTLEIAPHISSQKRLAVRQKIKMPSTTPNCQRTSPPRLAKSRILTITVNHVNSRKIRIRTRVGVNHRHKRRSEFYEDQPPGQGDGPQVRRNSENLSMFFSQGWKN